MTTIQYFPSLRDYTEKIFISRNKKKKNIADFIYEWISDDDPDDYFDLRSSEGYYRLNYNIITYLLVNYQELFLNDFTKPELLDFINNTQFYKLNNKMKNYEEFMKYHKINFNDFFLSQLKNIQILYNSLMTRLPRLSAIADISCYSKKSKRKECLILYRGFNYPRYKKMLQNINIDEVITTETFLSTSIQQLVAIKYAFNYDHDVSKHIIWKIIVKQEMFDNFNYTFISFPFNIQDNIELLFENSNIECEVLLNIGALLKCVAINTYNFEGYYIQGYNIPEKKYIEYTFEFIGWNFDYIDNINSCMNKYIRYLK